MTVPVPVDVRDFRATADGLADEMLERAPTRVRLVAGLREALQEACQVGLTAFETAISAVVPGGHALPPDSLAAFFTDEDLAYELSEILRGRHPSLEQIADACQRLADRAGVPPDRVAGCVAAFEPAFVGALEQHPDAAAALPLGNLVDDPDAAVATSVFRRLAAFLKEAELAPGAIHGGRITADNVVSGIQFNVYQGLVTSASGAPVADPHVEALRPYVERVLVATRTLSFGDPTHSAITTDGPTPMHLSGVWTPLRVVDFDDLGVEGRSDSERSFSLLHGANERLVNTVIAEQQGSLLILGEPGSGKSTLANHLASSAAARWLEEAVSGYPRSAPVPVRVFLRDVQVSDQVSKADLWTGVPELGVLASDPVVQDVAPIRDALLRSLTDGNAWLLLDGLDEVREDALPRMRELIDLVTATVGQHTRVIVTCRTYDYVTPSPSRRIGMDRTVRLLPYRTDDVRAYVERWYAEAARIGRYTVESARREAERLINSIDAIGELRDLAGSPLLLALLTVVHSEEGALPDSRALVAHRAVRYLLADTAVWKGAGGLSLATTEMMDLAQHVAFVAHSRIEKQGVEFRGLTRTELRNIVSEFHHLDEQPWGARYAEVSEQVTRHVSRLVQSNGLLVDQGHGVYAFAHRQFQEFLAGQYFAPGSRHEEALRAAQDPHWRESFRLLAGYGARDGGAFFYLLHLVVDLNATERGAQLPPFTPADALLAGEMLLEMSPAILKARGYGHVLSSNARSTGADGLWPRVASHVGALLGSVPPALPAAERVRAGNVAGALGDPRFLADGRLRPVTDRLCLLPPGTFSVGSPAGRGEEDERPRRSIAFPALAVGRYLVTNTEFGSFVAQGGYQDLEWWEPAEARAWVTGAPEFLEELRLTWIATVADYHGKELRDGEIRREQLEREAEARCAPRTAPFYWPNPRFNRPNQPVVGINWWEARAYASWLTDLGRRERWLAADEVLHLPTEFQWERACREHDDERTYPWGEFWDDDRAHTRNDELQLMEPTPVGCYPHGTWPGGPEDLCGNVWEWLEDRKLPYDAAYDALRQRSDSVEERAIRGSSWYNSPTLARSSARFVDRPYNLYFDVGFRLARSVTSRPG